MAGASSATDMPALHNLSVSNVSADDRSSFQSGGSSGYATPLTDPKDISTDSEQPTKTIVSDAQQSSGTITTPFPHPLSTCKPIARPALTTEQNSKYASVLQAVSAWTKLPTTTARNSASEPLSESERMWLTRECLLRYLRASSWSTADALKRLQITLVWRREYGVESITADHVSEENETGKQVILGYDNNARPCMYMSPGKQNTKKSERQIQHLVYMLERLIDMMDPGQDMVALLINFKNSTSGGSPSVAQGRQVMTILQGHYPERLGKALIADLPWFISTFFKLISPFIDPVTKEKMVFNDDLAKYIPPSQLDKANGGVADFQYDHSKYWPALTRMCEERRAAYKERWVRGGKKIGEYEAYLRGGEQPSLAELST